MSRVISELLGTDNREFSKIIERLELMTLHPGVDVKLTAEIITQSRQKARGFGCEPSESTAKELYYAMLANAEFQDNALRAKIGINDKTKLIEASQKMARKSESLLKNEQTLSLQPAAVKRVLKAVPPKKTLKKLKFRSLESVLKRESPLVLYALAKRLEDASWQKQIAAKFKRLETRDAAQQSVKVISLPLSWSTKVKNIPFDNVVQPIPEIGSILLLPTIPIKQKGSVFLTMSLVLQAGQRMSIESLPYRTKALISGVETLIPNIAAGYIEQFKQVHGLQPSWQAVYQLLLEHSKHHLPDFDLILGDLQWESTETKLASLLPDMDIWVDSHYLGYVSQPLPVSMHVIDVAASLVLERKYGEQVVSHMRASLWNELQIRYMKQDSIERAVIDQLSLAQGLVL